MLEVLIFIWLIGVHLFLVAMVLEPGNGESYGWNLLLPVIVRVFWPILLVALILYAVWEKWSSRVSIKPNRPRRRYRRMIWVRPKLFGRKG